MRGWRVGSLAYRLRTLITRGKWEIIFRFKTKDRMCCSPVARQSSGNTRSHYADFFVHAPRIAPIRHKPVSG
jgi:hypothetical protein